MAYRRMSPGSEDVFLCPSIMDIRDKFWFVLGWALADDRVDPEDAKGVADDVAKDLERNRDADNFAKYVMSFIYPANEARETLRDLAFRAVCYQIELRDHWNQEG